MIPSAPFPCVIIDTETSGLTFHDFATIIEIGAVYLDPTGNEAACFSSLVKPIFHLDLSDPACAKAMEVNQIDPDVLDYAPDAEAVWNALVWWSGLFGPGVPISAWPLQFDRRMMEKTWGVDRVNRMPWASFCIKKGTAARRPKGKKRISLAGMADELAIVVEGTPHRALTDARTTGRIWKAVQEGRMEAVLEAAV